jgi:hypothetical protein
MNSSDTTRAIAIARERLTSILVGMGVPHPTAEQRALTVTYNRVQESENVVIDAGDRRAVTSDTASMTKLAGYLAALIPRQERAAAPNTGDDAAMRHRSTIAGSF